MVCRLVFPFTSDSMLKSIFCFVDNEKNTCTVTPSSLAAALGGEAH